MVFSIDRDLRGLHRRAITRIAISIVNLLLWSDRHWGESIASLPLFTCALLDSSAFQTGCDIGQLAFPKYQTANHVTSHT